jgi:protein O-mannosyl-transferase
MRERPTSRRGSRAQKVPGAHYRDSDALEVAVFCILLLAGTVFLYGSVREHSFINWDDNDYVVQNAHVTSGLSIANLRWSLGSFEACNWHPLTWMSHQLDCELFGVDAGDHHLVSAALHALNALLLFLILYKFAGDPVRSFVVAALFAWHPFNVESVAWIAERKNLLSTFWFLAALGAYGYYALRPQLKYFSAVAVCFALALAAKPMAVTLPFVLLLLDYWPLQRVRSFTRPNPRLDVPQFSASRMVLEKLPLLALSAASSAVTVLSQRGCALRTLTDLTLFARVENACYCYLVYVWKALIPFGFGLFYPFVALPWWKVALALVLLIAIGIVTWKERITRPYLIVGWLWYLGTLIPMIGVVQVGRQAMADRYAYIPLIGIFIMCSWLIFEGLDKLQLRIPARIAVVSLLLLALVFLTNQEISYWQNSTTIWSHTLEVTRDNWVAEGRLGSAYRDQGDLDQAIAHFRNAENLNPEDLEARVSLGLAYGSQGRFADAIQELEAVVKFTDGRDSAAYGGYRCSALLNLGFAYALSKDYGDATTSFHLADQTDHPGVERTAASLLHSIAIAPNENDYLNLSLLLRAQGKENEAQSLLKRALLENPGYARVADLLQFLNRSGRL